MEEDRISALPDRLILEILSRLPKTKEAIKTSTLSKRWQHLWTRVPNIIFIPNDCAGVYDDKEDFYRSVDKTLTQCSPELNLNKFQLHAPHYHASSASDIDEWILYAVKRNVLELDISIEPFNFGYDYEYRLDEFFYINSCFTHLKLKECRFDYEAISWNKLKSLSISEIKLDEDVIQNILSGSPLLETFELSYCHGYTRIDITSKSVKNLVFSGYINYKSDHDGHIIEINAPNIWSLKIQNRLWLWKLSLADVSYLAKAHLDYTNHTDNRTTHEQLEEDFLRGLILKLHHVKELTIGTDCGRVIARLQAKGLSLPSNIKYLGIT